MLKSSIAPSASTQPTAPLLRAHRPAFFQQRTFRRMQALVLGQIFSFARRTVTQALVALGLTDHDWSGFYRLFNEPRMDYEELTRRFLRETLEHIPRLIHMWRWLTARRYPATLTRCRGRVG